MTDRYHLRPITPEEFEAFSEVPFEAFIQPNWHAESVEHERKIFEFDRSLAAFDGAAMVGTAAAYSFRLTVPGGAVGAGGVTIVSVLPCHRRCPSNF
jgi:predicted N-acetyltransferase YhbS